MKNFVQPGNTITLTAPYAVASGDGLLVGSIFGIAAGAAAIGEPVETALVGVFDITKVGSQAWTVGAKVYWDDTNKRTTTVATDNTLIGAAVEAVASGAGDTIEYAYLEGQQGAYIETRNGFDVDGVEIKCRLDFGAKAIDWRGLYKNPGA